MFGTTIGFADSLNTHSLPGQRRQNGSENIRPYRIKQK
jgi:hypothetical protein